MAILLNLVKSTRIRSCDDSWQISPACIICATISVELESAAVLDSTASAC